MLVFMATPIEKAGKIKVKPIQHKHQPRLRSTSDLSSCVSASRQYSADLQMAPVRRPDDTSLSSARSSVTSDSSSISGLSETDKTKISPIMKKPRVKLKRTQPVLRSRLRQPVIEKPTRVVSDYFDFDELPLPKPNKVSPHGNKQTKKRHSLSSAIDRNPSLRAKRSNSTGSVLDLPPQSFKSSLKRLGSAQNISSPSKSVSFRISNRSPRTVHQRSRVNSVLTRGRSVSSRSINRTASSPNRSVSVRSNTRPNTSPSRSVSFKGSLNRLSPGSPSHANRLSPGSPSHANRLSSGSPSHANRLSCGSPSHANRLSSGSPSHANRLSSGSPSHANKLSSGSPSHANRLSSGSPSHANRLSSGSPSHANRLSSGSSSHANRLSSGSPSNANRLSSGSPSHANRSNSISDQRSKNGKKINNPNSVDEIAQYVIKQCRIGPEVAFGLVHVNNNSNNKPTSNGFTDGHGLVTIRMKPDEQGRFGFNVKGGADQGMPIIVSRVAPNTPADLSIPRLNEGDQVLFINGRDMSQHTHEQVVMFIKASRETHSGELVVMVRPNVYVGEDVSDEPDYSYTPETHTIASSNNTNTLQSSLLLLQESLDSGAALAQFEQLYRKKPNMSMNSARLECNIAKNRYRDISPYDQTRVILKGSTSGDYVNANFVNMEIPGSGIVNRYIAAQGPLQNTCTDFWQMVWEQQCTLVVMLTTKVERGRVKCHQYWPELYETQDFGSLQITCVKEEDTTSFAFREFNLTHVETNEERHIRHMQYISWPDHGVPDDPGDFLQFVVRVRQSRAGMVEPTVVHCSAGIGRTGVLITMETAMCLIEANQPCFPLQIVKNMRDQRAMLIQTSSQYKFVCEAILRVYHEGIVKPVDDFQR